MLFVEMSATVAWPGGGRGGTEELNDSGEGLDREGRREERKKRTSLSLSLSIAHAHMQARTHKLSPSFSVMNTMRSSHTGAPSLAISPVHPFTNVSLLHLLPSQRRRGCPGRPSRTCNVHGLWWCRSKIPHSALCPPATHMQTRCSFAPFCSHLFLPVLFCCKSPFNAASVLKGL